MSWPRFPGRTTPRPPSVYVSGYSDNDIEIGVLDAQVRLLEPFTRNLSRGRFARFWASQPGN